MDDNTERLAEKYNKILEDIATEAKEDKGLGNRLKFLIRLKKAPRWHQIYEFHGPDIETAALLTQYRTWWTVNPALFFTQTLRPLQGVSHPFAAAAGQCLWREQHDAWGAMIRRAHLVNFSRMQKAYDLPMERMAEILQPHFTSYTRADLIRQVSELLRRGSVLDAFIQDTCPGFIYAVGHRFTDLYVETQHGIVHPSNVSRWEQRISKTGPDREAVLLYLKSIHFMTFASTLNPMAEAIGKLLFDWTVSVERVADLSDSLPNVGPGPSYQGRQGWDASVEIFAGPLAFEGR